MPDGLPRIGVDTEPLARFENPDLRLFTSAERELAVSVGSSAEFYAGRWCAKEAVVKAAWPHVHLSPRDIEILRDTDGRPTARLLREVPALHIDVSISHSAGTATAVALVIALD